MTTRHSLSEQVALVERKLEVRRARTRRHWHEVQTDVQRIAERSARWTPLVGVVALAVGKLRGRRVPRRLVVRQPRLCSGRFLHIPTGKKLTMCVAKVVADHFVSSAEGLTGRPNGPPHMTSRLPRDWRSRTIQAGLCLVPSTQ